MIGLILCVVMLTACDITTQLEETGWKPFSDKREPLEEKHLHYVALGDSLTEGVGDEMNNSGYVGRLAENMASWEGVSTVTVDNTAKRGRRSDQLLTQLESGDIDNALKKANFITLTMGGNDLMKIARQHIQNLDRKYFDEEVIAYEKRYAKILRLIRKQNKTAPIVAIGIYNPFTVYTEDVGQSDDIMKMYNTKMKDLIEKENNYAIFVPVSDLYVTNNEHVYHTDYFHPNAKGYDRMTTRILETLKQEDLYTLTKHQYDFGGQKDEEENE
ncbi:GDSL-type esterase/lipase family protein [Kurthia senegalensis]|uniref:GDSL-type esterase/lipase family protein n=2 Tax=Kurthia senegalensis TaxID=1033740 RepID=UPI00028971F7|nr:GDSL-type esterase/lipase family protein [Kurthia senegalensis]